MPFSAARVVARLGPLCAFLAVALATACAGVADEPTARAVDATTLKSKVLCGYQGWFRCPGDPAGEGWRHWSRSSSRLAPDTVAFEMWPDVSEYDPDETYVAPGFTYADGAPARLFSSADRSTVLKHFEWMRAYDIDGVFAQRFLVELGRPSLDLVLEHVRRAAAETGRIYAVCYDLTGVHQDRIHETLTNDWKRLVRELKVTDDERYLHHDGKPVVFVWGFYSDRFPPEVAHRIIDFFETEGDYAATLVGGCQWNWRDEQDPEWARAFRRFDVISPWNVGNYREDDGRLYAATEYWTKDLAAARQAGMEYLPVIYPGFGWTNLKGADAARATIPRLGGEFYWRQFHEASEAGVTMAYVAMFDEVDEGTAVFKVANGPPTQARFATFEGLPPDWYLRLTSEGARVIRRERKSTAALPIAP